LFKKFDAFKTFGCHIETTASIKIALIETEQITFFP